MVVKSELVQKNQSIAGVVTVTSTQKKKKRANRQRNRPRNKRNRIQNDQVQLTDTEHQQSTSSSDSSPEKVIKSNLKLPAAAESIEMKPVNATEPQTQGINVGSDVAATKTREQIMAEREAKKLAKQAKKTKSGDTADTAQPNTNITANGSIVSAKTTNNPQKAAVAEKVQTAPAATTSNEVNEKSREQIKAEREAKKAAKHAIKTGKTANDATEAVAQQLTSVKLTSDDLTSIDPAGQEKKKPTLSKAERRAIQEAQRAAKAEALAQKNQPAGKTIPAAATKITPTSHASNKKELVPTITTKTTTSPSRKSMTSSPARSVNSNIDQDCKVKLFNHLEHVQNDISLFINDPWLHPSIARLGEQYAKRTIVGSNARCIAFLNALKQVVQDFVTPQKKEFTRSLEAAVKHHVDHLHKCRPLAVSVNNAYKQFKNQLLQLPTDNLETDHKEILTHFIDTYIENQIGKAALAISSSLQEKITNGDVILTFGCSSLIDFICEGAKERKVDFRVIVVDSRPYLEGRELLRRLTDKGIPCTYVLINAISFVMSEATKVLLGAHALLSNGYVMARTGSAQVALVAHSYNVPVLVCCETHKFSERFQTDAIVYNELGNPDDLIMNNKCCLTNWQAKSKMTPLNLNYDITPPELVTAVVTEVSILPCTSVPVILRIKPDIGY